jgi:hypothetical protein
MALQIMRDVGARYNSPTMVDAGAKLARTAAEGLGAMSEHPEPRRFPPPWTVVENAESFVVKDAQRRGAPKFDLGPSESTGGDKLPNPDAKKSRSK